MGKWENGKVGKCRVCPSLVVGHQSLVVVVKTFPDYAGVVASRDEVAGYFLDSLKFGKFGFSF